MSAPADLVAFNSAGSPPVSSPTLPNHLTAAPARHAAWQSINLHQIAIEAMRRQDLLPVFAPLALQEADSARPAAAQADHGDIADLRQ